MKTEQYTDWCADAQAQYIERTFFEACDEKLPLLLLECGSSRMLPGGAVDRGKLDYHVLEFIEEGEAELALDGETYRLRPGDLYYLELGSSYSLRVTGDRPLVKWHLILLRSFLHNLLLTYRQKIPTFARGCDAKPLLEQLLQLGREKKGGLATFGDASRLLNDLALEVCLQDVGRERGISAAHIRDILQEHIYDSGFQLEDISNQLHISVVHLISVFRKAYGTTPHKYLIKCRIQAAADLLATGNDSIGEIAELLGFTDQHHLSNVFRRQMDISPSGYRRIYSTVKQIDKNRIPSKSHKKVSAAEYIHDNWERCIVRQTQDNGGVIGLPYPFLVPVPDRGMGSMLYWPTYFANKGLILDGLSIQAQYNVMNMFALIDRFGYVPNGSSLSYLSRSQPPCLSMMVSDLYESTQDLDWLKTAYDMLVKEYNWWQANRSAENGLNRYGIRLLPTDPMGENMSNEYEIRTGRALPDFTPEERIQFAGTMCESGWDFTPRTGLHAADYAWVDLNSLLFGYEDNFARFSNSLKNGQDEFWQNRKYERQAKMNRYLWNGEFFCDYDFVRKKQSDLLTCAAFYPLFTRAATAAQARKMRDCLRRLEFEHGLAVCEPGARDAVYRWDYPNGWAPLHYIVVMGLNNYRYYEDARRIATKFVRSVERNFERTGHICEVYNVVTGGTDVGAEYGVLKIFTWAAGVYLALRDYLKTWEQRADSPPPAAGNDPDH